MPEHRNYLSVSDLNSKIRYSLENNLSSVWVKGEVSNFHHHPSSGHMYFTLKDDKNEIRCAMFRVNNQFLNFIPSDGVAVRLFGDVTFFEQRGSIQIKVSMMEEDGVGDLYKAYEKLKINLEKEGLFDNKHKKSLPLYPSKIGIITSGSGAAVRDIINVLGRRAPQVTLVLKSVKVQGDGASNEISEAIKLFNLNNNIDLIIIGRGGGSIEDLWAFNEEVVARSIFKSSIPIISAVGHETDYSISDFVSDVRAPTPSAAAEIAAVAMEEILKDLKNFENRIIDIIRSAIEKYWLKKDQLERRITVSKPQQKIKTNLIESVKIQDRLQYTLTQKFLNLKNEIESFQKRLFSLGPDNVLKRGFTIALDSQGRIIKSSEQLSTGDEFRLKTGKGSFCAKKL